MRKQVYLLLIFMLAVFPTGLYAQLGIISTIAGTGTGSYTGDGGPATAATIYYPWGIGIDGTGNIYIAAEFNRAIRRVSTSGTMSTFAGTGTGGYSGDGGPATAATFTNPADIAFDASGNAYITDWGAHVVRKVNTSGTISTFAGTGVAGFSGDGGQATAARLNDPIGIAVDGSGNVYIGDGHNNRIRMVSTTGVITTVAGTGTGSFSGDGGPASAATFNYIYNLAFDAAGNLYVGDALNNRVRKINTSWTISTYAGGGSTLGDGGPATAANLSYPNGVDIDASGNVYIADRFHNRVRKVDAGGTITTFAGTGTGGFSGDGGPATAANVNAPLDMVHDAPGNIYISDELNNRIRKVNGQNHIPYFTGGTFQNITVCEYAPPDSLNSILTVIDTDVASAETWSLILPPVHGTVAAPYTGTSTTTLYTPHGLTYTPTPGYSGADSFRMRVTDGYGSDTITIYVTVVPEPLTITGMTPVCAGSTFTLSDTVTGGTWTSSPTTIATIGSLSGVVTGVSGGTATITYSVSLSCGPAMVTTTVSILPTPAPITGTPTVCVGATTTLSDATSGGVWLSGSTGIATVGATTGIVTGVATGTAIITYALGSCQATIVVTVNASPATISGTPGVCVGATSALADATPGGTWTSSLPAVGSVGPLTGILGGISFGTCTITYTLPGGCFATLPVTVNSVPPPITGIFTLCAGGGTTTLYETGTGTWSSASTGIATIGSTSGIVTGVAPGTSLISYTLSTGCRATATVTVNDAPAPITGGLSLCMGTGDTLHDPTFGGAWTSSDYTIAYIDPSTGALSGLSIGYAVISYTMPSGCFATAIVSVNPAPTPITGIAGVCTGGSDILYDGVSGGTWTSASPGVATIIATSGVYTGLTPGTSWMTYSMGPGCSSSFLITVYPMPPPFTGPTHVCPGSTITLTDAVPGGAWSTVSSGIATIGTGTGVLTGIVTGTTVVSYSFGFGVTCATAATITVDATPSPITGTLHACPGTTTALASASPGGTWTSSTTSVATIGSVTGLVTGSSTGTTVITYTLPTGCYRTAVVTINPLPAAITGPGTVCIGATITLADATTGGTWSRSNTNVTVGLTSGITGGVTAGTSVITYTLPTGCYATKNVTVSTSPGAITGTLSVCQGSTTVLGNPAPGGTWTSGAPSIASVGLTTGIVSGASAGLATITYSVGSGCVATAVVTVVPLPAVISGSTGVCAGGGSMTLTDASPGGTWSSTGTTATIGSTTGFVTGITAGVYPVTYTVSGCSRTAIITVNPLPGSITGPSALCAGGTVILTDPSPGGSWTSGTTTIATIGSSSGLVTGITTGTTSITYTLPTGCRTITTETVSSAPSAIIGPSSVCTGSTITLTDAVPGGAWNSSTSSATIGSLSGVVTGMTAGTTTITYSLGTGCIVSRTLTVTAGPGAISGPSSLCIGTPATVTDPTTGGTWTSGSTGIATVGATSGVVTPLAAGTVTITYTIGTTSCLTTRDITVNPSPTAISGPASVCTGSSITALDGTSGGTWSTTSSILTIGSATGAVTGTTAGTAAITYAIGACTATRLISVNPISPIVGTSGMCVGAVITLTDATTGGAWTSSAPGTATIGTSSGMVTAMATGTTTISYTMPTGCTATKSVTVTSGPAAIGGTLRVCPGSTTTLTDATGGGAWSSSSTSIAGIGSTTGMVTGSTTGTAIITYSLGPGCSVTAMLTVNPLPGAITGLATLCAGASATLTDASAGGSWSSSDPSTVAIGSSSGVVTGVVTGTATITYTLPTGCVATRTETITPGPGAISGPSTVCVAMTGVMTDATTGGTWSSSPTSVATIGASSGILTGIAAGPATVTYSTTAGCAVTKSVTINPAPAPIIGASVVCAGSGATLTDVVTGGTWSSSDPSVAIVGSTTGAVTGVTAGTLTITYTAGAGCYVTKSMTVVPVPGPITGPATVLCIGTAITLGDATPGGTWTSSNPIIATVGSSSGIATGINTGTATITYSIGTGCMVTRVISVNAAPPPITGTNHMCVGGSVTLSIATTGGSWSSGATSVATVVPTSGVVTGAGGGITTISYTLSAGCIMTYNVTVTAVPPITGLLTKCAWGDTMTVHDADPTGLYTGTVSTVLNLGTGNGRITTFAPGTSTVTYTLPSGCSTTQSFTVNPLPGTITGSPNVCPGSTSSLADASPGGTWTSFNPAIAAVGSSTGVVTGVALGTTVVTYTLPTGCRAVDTIHVVPGPSMIVGYPSMVIGTNATYTDATPGGTWSSAFTGIATIGTTTGIAHAVATGTATLIYTVTATGCKTTKNVTVTPATGISPDGR